MMLRWLGFALQGMAFLCIFSAMLIFMLPGAKQSIIEKAYNQYAPRMVPILLAHEPQLSTLTYDNTASYCTGRAHHGASMEFGGISDVYVCSLIENRYVTSTQELQLRLARELISIKSEDIMVNYGLEIARLQSRLLPLLAASIICAFLSFTFLYFGSRDLLRLAFSAASSAAIFSFIIFLICAISLFLLPPFLVGMAKDGASTLLEKDLVAASQGPVSETAGEFFLPPMLFFGLLSVVLGLSASSLYYYLAKTKN